MAEVKKKASKNSTMAATLPDNHLNYVFTASS